MVVSEAKSLETKLVDMMMDMHGREASLLHWVIKRKPDVMYAMYELWKKDVDPADSPEYIRDPESLEAVVHENWKTGMGKIKLIKMLREMSGKDLRDAKNQVEEWTMEWEKMEMKMVELATPKGMPEGVILTPELDGITARTTKMIVKKYRRGAWETIR